MLSFVKTHKIIKLIKLLPGLLCFFACSLKQSDVQSPEKATPGITGRTEEAPKVTIKNTAVHQLKSVHTTDTYDIYVSFPGNYQGSAKTYPLLVVLDGEVNFGAVCYIVDRLARDKLIPELVVAAIAYPGETREDVYYSRRCRDFTPTVDKNYEKVHTNFTAGTGDAENFAAFMANELLPYLAANYPVKAHDRTIYGHSFGGLFGMHVLLNHPDLFDNYVLLSPSLWWGRGVMLKHVKPDALARQRQIYMATVHWKEKWWMTI